MKIINIIGAGLSGTEAALQLANKGYKIKLYEVKRINKNPAQTSTNFSELVCSNSFRGLTNAVGELKNELFHLNSELMNVAEVTKVPAGNALAVNREEFSLELTKKLEAHPNITIIEEEFNKINDDEITIVASGPLTTEKLIEDLKTRIDIGNLHFYDAIAPIIDASTINMDIAFKASRWQKKDDEATGDYINCPMSKEQYEEFIEAMSVAERVELHSFEKYFEGCLPIEVMQERSSEQLRFGPMKPVGLFDPRFPGHRFHAVVQLRMEDKEGKYYNLVGFQTKLKYKDQKVVFRKIPGLENVEFLRYGSIHRNTFINAPQILEDNLSVKDYPNLYITGQLSGVEGYVESIAMGMLTALVIDKRLKNESFNFPPPDTAFGALYAHLRNKGKVNFQPSNINFSLFAGIPLPRKIKKKEKNAKRIEHAINKFQEWTKEENIL